MDKCRNGLNELQLRGGGGGGDRSRSTHFINSSSLQPHKAKSARAFFQDREINKCGKEIEGEHDIGNVEKQELP